MLYERWRQVAREHEGEIALWESASGSRWTFGELARRVEALPPSPVSVVYPQGHSARFICDVLLAWRSGVAACPLEPGQAPPPVPPPPPGCAHLKTTSATTGAPRVVAFTAAQLAADPDHIVPTMGLRSDWPNLGVISLAHSYGFSNLVLPLLLHGIPLVLAPSPLPEAVRQTARGHTALTLPAVPALWRAWHEAGAVPPSAKLAISAGAPLSLALEQAVFERCGLKIHNFYGASECGGIAYDRSATPRADATLAGAPLHNVSVGVADSDCLEVRGANVAQGYWPEATPDLGDGVFRTSDLAAIRDGQVFLLGRASDVINVAGRKVAPETIERALLAHPQVREALALGLAETDGSREEIIAAVVAATRPFPEAELRRFLSERLPPWQTPRVWHFVECLERNDRGKVSRAEWRRRLLHGR